MKTTVVAALVLVLGGCVATPAPTTVHWDVSNHSDRHITYTIMIEGGAATRQANGSLAPGQTQEQSMTVKGAELTAIIRLQGAEEAAVLPSFAEPGCDLHRLEAVWNGTWSLRWHSADC